MNQNTMTEAMLPKLLMTWKIGGLGNFSCPLQKGSNHISPKVGLKLKSLAASQSMSFYMANSGVFLIIYHTNR